MTSVLEEWPWAYVLLDSHAMQNCHYCLQKCDDPLECSVCEFARKAWPDHNSECFLLARSAFDLPDALVRLISRVLLKINTQGSKTDSLMTTTLTTYKKLTFDDLQSHNKNTSDDPFKAFNFAQCVHKLHMYMDNERIPDSAELMNIYGKILFNSMLILNNDLNPIGIGIYLALSQFEHSCIPNSVVVFNGPMALLNYLSPNMPDNKEVATSYTLSYVPIMEETDTRRRNLYNEYYFICQCTRCLDEKLDLIATSLSCKTAKCPGHVTFPQPKEFKDSELTPTPKSESTAMAKCDLCGRIAENLWLSQILMIAFLLALTARCSRADAKFNMIVDLYKKETQDLHPLNVYLIRTKCILTNACVCRGLTSDALKHYEELLPLLRYYLPDNHPMLAVVELNIGNLQCKFKNWDIAKCHFVEAAKIMKFSHSRSHPLRKTAARCVAACETAMKKGIRTVNDNAPPSGTPNDQGKNRVQLI
uniref:MYND-type domain-containing protein n=1 Tax=Trichuris muris TaxID=70415 RepID=A0A5S6QW18_TRIMR